MKFKPTTAEWKLINDVAFRGHYTTGRSIKSVAGVRLECRDNISLSYTGDTNINRALVSDQWPHCSDLDVYDRSKHHTDMFREGADLTEDGRGLFDFYIYNRYHRDDGDLCGNVLVRVVDGKLHSIWIEGGRNVSWTPQTGIAKVALDRENQLLAQ